MSRPAPQAQRTVTRGARLARACALLVAWMGALILPGTARAEGCPVPSAAAPALADVPAESRIAFLRRELDAERPAAHAWTWAWGSINGALTVGQLAAVPFVKSPETRALLATGAGLSALGVAQVVLLPITPPREAGDHEDPDRCAVLARLEGHLETTARHVAAGTGVAAQAGNLVINAGYGAATGYVDQSWRTGLLTFALGWAIGEAQILTEPRGLLAARDRYRAGDLGPPPSPRADRAPGPALSVGVGADRRTWIAVAFRF